MPTPRQPAADLATDLKERLRSGQFLPGQRLVEADLVRDTGASRSKVREALRHLAAEGLVVIDEFRGASVRRLTQAEAAQISRAREVLEGLAARLAAEIPLKPLERGHLKKLQEDMDDAARAKQAERYARLNEAFHAFILNRAGNAFVTAFVERLRIPLFRLQFQAGWGGDPMLRRNVDHQKITRAILKGDPDAAEAAMREHLRNGSTAMAEIDSSFFGHA